MPRVDLHVHTRFSDHPSEWFLQRLGAAESYTDPEKAYALAKSRGMDFVAITDHNCITGALELATKHDDVIVGAEVTSYFPEDGCKVHILVWGLDERRFEAIDAIRTDVVALRDYLRDEDLPHSVAHATFSVNDRLTAMHLEKLVVLFDVFETVNGARTRRQNTQWETMLDHLTPQLMGQLVRKHRLEPFSDRPWIKGRTGGSDDHAGLLIGRTWTEAVGTTPEEFLGAVADRASRSAGRHNDSRTLAFSVYKIASDYSKSRATGSGRRGDAMQRVHNLLFEPSGASDATGSLRERIARIKASKDPLAMAFFRLIDDLESAQSLDFDQRLDIAHERISDIADELAGSLLASVREDLAAGDVFSLVRNVSAALPAAFLAAPFFSTAHLLSKGRAAADEFALSRGLTSGGLTRTLWFTDTLDDLNGVSVTLQNVARYAGEHDLPVKIVTCGGGDGARTRESVIDLPTIHHFELPYYESYALSVPSIMRSLRIIQDAEPDVIIVSTPGPVGLLGAACAKILDVPLKMVFHTDFTAQSLGVTRDESLADMVDVYQNWFYGLADEILVPTSNYLRVLLGRGFDNDRLRVFRRGIDTTHFSPQSHTRAEVCERFGLDDAPTLLFVGRLSRDKAVDTLVEAYREVVALLPDVNLIVAGDGPYAGEMRTAAAGLPRMRLVGTLDNHDLPPLYSAADLLVFPSKTDTFGMAVLEAQSCGLPALVSGVGGPQDIIVDGATGTVVSNDSVLGWAEAIFTVLVRLESDPDAQVRMREAARIHASRYDWSTLFEDVLGIQNVEDAHVEAACPA